MERISQILENERSVSSSSSSSQSLNIQKKLHEKLLANAEKFSGDSKKQESEKRRAFQNKQSSLDYNDVISRVSDKASEIIDKKLVDTWIRTLKITKLDASSDSALTVDIKCPNRFAKQHIENEYREALSKLLSEVLEVEIPLTLNISVEETSKPASPSTSQSALHPRTTSSSRKISDLKRNTSAAPNQQSANLNKGYNFSNYVIGSCNQFAAAACLKVSENPGTSYNPLFIYGGVGLGKTHLANAVGNAALRRNKKVLLVSSETFVSELIRSLRTNSMDKFKSKFRSIDVLIIDDIQFIIGKERTQEEFFHTFNELYGKQKQIIITSDKLPQDLIGLEERLRTRFSSGLSVDLQAPDFETRVAILTKKAEHIGLGLNEEVAKLIAQRINTNVRELEGALTRLQALSSLMGQAATMEMAKKVVDTINPIKTVEITTKSIKEAVAKRFNVSVNDLTGKRRTQNIALARQAAMYLCRKHTARSFPEIGAIFGGRDHSTVIHAIKSVTEKIKVDADLKDSISYIQSTFESQ